MLVNKGKKFLSDLKYYTDYSKWIEAEQKYENWEESCKDVMNTHRIKYEDKLDVLSSYIDEAEESYKEKIVTASQRNLQYRGEQIIKKNERMFNCFEKNTEFITSEGVKSFNDFEYGDSCIVQTHTGNWKNAVVKKYGVQKLFRVTFSKGSRKEDVLVTKDHRWLLRKGVETTNLTIGDKILSPKNIFQDFNWETASLEEKIYWCYGLIYGDGTKVVSGNNTYSMIRLCGNNSKFEERFKQLGFKSTRPLSIAGDVMVYTGKYLKTTPNPSIDSPELIRAFVHGYLEANGQKNRNKTGKKFLSIQSSEIEHIDFIRKCFPVAGVFINNETDLTGQKTNYGTRPYTIKFHLTEGTNGSTDQHWVVTNIVEEKEDEVWCLEVEDDRSFILNRGIVTGNCATLYLDKIESFHKAFYLTLCGCGVGVSMLKHWVEKLPNLKKRNGEVKNFIISDSIEGWADAAGVLISSYSCGEVPFPEYQGCIVRFDYTRIRPKGSKISGGFKAPGHEGLKQSLERIECLFESSLSNKDEIEFKSIIAYDVLMHLADATLSGGVRRAAVSVIVDLYDLDMINAKTGDWRTQNKQRERSNNSVGLIRGFFTEEQFNELLAMNQGTSDIGFCFLNNIYEVFNPCFEIGMTPILDFENETTGVEFCNLVSIIGSNLRSNGKFDREKFKRAARSAAIIGTLQAGYVSYPYLGKISEDIVKKESLVGVSISGWMNSPELFDEELLKEGVKIIKEVNEELSAIIGINPAARLCTSKPDGNLGALVGSASGIHPEHSKRYFRIMQINKETETAKWLEENVPEMLEESEWSSMKSDYVVYIPIETNNATIYKDQMKGINHLEKIAFVQKHWVEAGKIKERCILPTTRNSVSCTVIIDDYDKVGKYVFENQDSFAAVSFLSDYGDKDYIQAPFTSVLDAQELLEKYGDGMIFASGLIVDGLHYFDENLWEACLHVKDKNKHVEGTRTGVLLKKDWIRRAKQFAKNYFKNDVDKMIYCLKDTHLFYKWCKINKGFKDVDFQEILSKPVYNDVSKYAAVACAGGKCDL